MSDSRVIIYVDGENFLHRVEEVLKDSKIIKEKTQIINFSLRKLLRQVIPEYSKPEIRYYGTRVHISGLKESKVLERAEAIAESQRRLKRDLTNQNITFITAGSLRVRDTSCRNCGKTTQVFKEKGVDVRMAVDIIEDASSTTHQIILSSDSDLLPAIRVARKSKNSRITYVHYAEQPNYALIKASQESRVYTNNQVKRLFNAAKVEKGR